MISTAFRSIRMAAYTTVFTGLMVTAGAWAQDTSVSTTSQTGEAKVTTDVARGEVEYVSGNDLVVKMSDGQVKHFVVPAGFKFNVDGKDLTVGQLKPGMHLTRTITTVTVPKTVTTVRTIEGKVWYINPPSTIIVQFPDGTNKQYKIPSGQKFSVDGDMKDAFHLKKGMNISATVVTDAPVTVASQDRTVTGRTPPPPPQLPAPQPNVQTAILVETPGPAPAPAASSVQTAKATLPKTASEVPLIGLIGLVLLTAGLTWKKLDA
jgi:hypothetical protein